MATSGPSNTGPEREIFTRQGQVQAAGPAGDVNELEPQCQPMGAGHGGRQPIRAGHDWHQTGSFRAAEWDQARAEQHFTDNIQQLCAHFHQAFSKCCHNARLSRSTRPSMCMMSVSSDETFLVVRSVAACCLLSLKS